MRAFVLAFLIAGCTEPTTEDGPIDGPVSYSQHIQPIWDQSCVRCHAPTTMRRQEPFLVAGASYAALMEKQSFCYLHVGDEVTGLPLVAPHDPDASGILFVTGGDRPDVGCLLGAMPRGTPGLRTESPADWELLRRWVIEGALDN